MSIELQKRELSRARQLTSAYGCRIGNFCGSESSMAVVSPGRTHPSIRAKSRSPRSLNRRVAAALTDSRTSCFSRAGT